jgi:hypothetical protein
MHRMKGEVILRILVQESPKSELRLRRYGEKNFRDLFVISKKWLGLIWHYFSNSRAFLKICGLRVDIQEVQGPFYKVVGIKEFPDLIYNGKFRGPSLRCGGLAARSGPRDSAAVQPGSAGAGWETELTAGVHLTERDERERDQLGRREPKRKTYFRGDAIDTRARWAA